MRSPVNLAMHRCQFGELLTEIFPARRASSTIAGACADLAEFVRRFSAKIGESRRYEWFS